MSDDHEFFCNTPEINALMQHLYGWHAAKVAELEYITKVPSDGTLTVQIAENEDVAITDDVHKGFVLGIKVALIALGDLPFTLEMAPISEGETPNVH